MPIEQGHGRVITIIAVGFLELDGVLLGLAGLWRGKWGLLATGAGLALAGGFVLLYWHRHRKRLEEIAAARLEVGGEAQALQRLVSSER
jgi:uncharacterized membrane protein YccC